MADLVGQQLGNYRLIRLLGQGGFADVYLGQHVLIASQQAAIKILHLFDVNTQSFQQEAETTAALVHPHIVRLFDFDLQQGTPFLIMDYAAQGSLRNRHPKGTLVPLSSVIQYTKEIASALQYAHDNNIIHRDIKPENILIGRRNELLLSDFGLAMLSRTGRNSLEHGYNIGGTVEYMAPETYRGKSVKASDQYSLGVVVYEWLCGTPPFTEGNPIQIGYQHTYEEVPPLRKKLPSITPQVEEVVMKALAKDPKQRFPSVMDFVNALAQASQSASASSPVIIVPPPPSFPLDDKANQPTSPDNAATGTYQVPWDKSLPSWEWGASPPPSKEWGTPPPQSNLFNINATLPPEEALDEEEAQQEEKLRVASVIDQSSASPSAEEDWGHTFNPSPTVRPKDPSVLQSVQSFFVSLLPTVNAPPGTKGNVAQGTTISIWQGHTQEVYTVHWSPDGKYIASAGADKTIQRWEVSTTRKLADYRTNGKVYTVACSPDRKYLVSAGEDKKVQLWDIATAREHFSYRVPGEVYSVAWSPDGKYIASAGADRIIRVRDFSRRSEICALRGHTDWIRAIAWSPDGTYIASAGNDHMVHLWDFTSHAPKPVVTYKNHTDWVRAITWSPTGNYIASAGNDQAVHIWNAHTGATSVSYTGHNAKWTGGVLALAWSPDGKYIVSAGEDQTVHLWSPTNGKRILTYTGHSAPVDALAWSPDGQRIASGSYDRTVQVWQALGVTSSPTMTNTQWKTVQ